MIDRTNTKQTILTLGRDLLQEKGFKGFSYADISSSLGVKNAAIHYHFPTKDDLGLAILEQERRRFQKFTAVIAKHDNWTQLDGFFGIYTHYMDNGNKLCVPGSMSIHFPEVSSEMQQAAQNLVVEMRQWLAKILEQGRQAGEFVFSGPAEDKALLFQSSLQGATQIARMDSAKQLTTVIELIKGELRG